MRQQSGVIPFRVHRDDLQVLLITASKGPHWTVPKGHLEAGLTPKDSALKEAFEEAGVSGSVAGVRLGYFHYMKRGAARRVEIYPMLVTRVHRTWPEMLKREREWFDLNEAVRLVRFPDLGQMIVSMSRRHTVLQLVASA